MQVCKGVVERGSRWEEERRALPAIVHTHARQGFKALIVGCASIFVLRVEISTNPEPTTLPGCGEEIQISKHPSLRSHLPVAPHPLSAILYLSQLETFKNCRAPDASLERPR